MTITVSPVQTDIYTAVRAFLLTIVPAGTGVVQGIVNRVPLPPAGVVVMTIITQNRIATNEDDYTDPFPTPGGTQQSKASQRVEMQLDFYGGDSQAWATMVETLWRDEVGCVALAPTVQPLYADDPRQLPLITGEEQYLQRWMLKAAMQYNPVTVTVQDFAGTLEATLINVDEAYPP